MDKLSHVKKIFSIIFLCRLNSPRWNLQKFIPMCERPRE